MLVYAILISLFALVIRVIPRWGIAQYGADSGFYLHFSEQIRKNKFRMPKRIKGFMLNGKHGWPALPSFLLAFFSKKQRVFAETFFGPISDALQTFFIFIATNLVTNDVSLSLIAATLFAITPLLMREDARVFALSGRALGGLFVAASLFSMIYFEKTQLLEWLLYSSIFTALTLLTHRFSTQALIVSTITLSLGLGEPLLLGVLVLGGVIATIASKGYYYRTIVHHITHSAFYSKMLVKKRPEMSENELMKIIRNFKNIYHPKRFLKNFYVSNVGGMISNTPTLVILFVLAIGFPGVIFTPENYAWLLWVFSMLFALVLTSTKPLRFLGGPGRYMEYAIMPISIIVGTALTQIEAGISSVIIIVILVWSALAYSKTVWLVRKTSRNLSDKSTKEFFKWLSKYKDKNVLCLPMNISYFVPYLTKNNVFYPGTSFGLVEEYDMEKVFDSFPYPSKKNFKEIIKKFNIDFVVVWDKAKIKVEGYNLKKVSFENKRYKAYDMHA